MDQSQPKKSFFKRFWWIWTILAIGLAVFAFAAYGGNKHDQQSETQKGVRIDTGKDGKTKAFSDTELATANLALANGIKIDDPQNDWYKFPAGSIQPDGRPDNSNPYPLGWTDFRSVSVGADQSYIYFKYQFWGTFPQKAVTYNGDLIESTGAKITSFTFVNSNGQKDSADLGAGPWYVTFENDKRVEADEVTIGQGAMISPTGRDERMETIFKTNTSVGMVGGGPGFDYVLSAFPLAIFNLKLGDEVTFDSSTETGSTVYHHEALDILLDHPGEKFGDIIKYKLGSNTYETVSNLDTKNHS